MGPALVLLAGLLLVLVLGRSRNTRKGTFPPGPKPLPFIGNVLDLTPKQLWIRTSEWAKTWGDVVYLHVFGQSLLVLNSYEAATDLMERKGALYSDRPNQVMSNQLCGCDNIMAFMGYGDQLRRQRRLMMKVMGPGAVPAYHSLIEAETHALLKRFLDTPQDYWSHIRRYAGSMTLRIVYGYHVTSNDDQFLNLAEETTQIFSDGFAGDVVWLVDFLPFLKHLPAWFPGAGFKRTAMQWKAQIEESVNRPFDMVLARMNEGTARPCFVTTLLQTAEDDMKTSPELDIDARWTSMSVYVASIDTTITSFVAFLHNIMVNPEMVAKAQKEIDSVVGPGRLPTFADRPSLPYVNAIFSEVLRWSAPVPLGLPHRTMEDDIYRDMYIPRGTIVFANVWQMSRNPILFPDPDAFNPERYLDKVDDATAARRDPRNFVFGFGRRRCPGAHLIESSLWMAIASFLATFDIKKAMDKDGNTIEPKIVYNHPIFRLPDAFECNIQPRSPQAATLIQQASPSP